MIEVAAFMMTMNFFRFGRNAASRNRVRGEHEAGQDVDLVAHHEFLGQPLGDRRRDAADVLADDLDLLAGDGVAVLLHVKLDAFVDLLGGVGELARIGQNDADLDSALRLAGGRHQARRQQGGAREQNAFHCRPPLDISVFIAG